MTQTTYNFDDPVQAAQFDLDQARAHLDAAIDYGSDAIDYLDGPRRTRAQEIHDRMAAALADLERLREAIR